MNASSSTCTPAVAARSLQPGRGRQTPRTANALIPAIANPAAPITYGTHCGFGATSSSNPIPL
ncbi:hypothetical protein DR950_10615 [Kitasatospora xanthocidica]|uniref:Uncharacterized protein n=1 Tax=Kitasatospora xanthocidica TaxID=83382 RepID=A0A372ZRU6_9ACTN|nr:hypothetical protein [Kitasatospora xanthocidica]RGD58182.1 hypothetical protein DR950_10615 [Kitasatospora xanthocidica]